MIQSTATIIAEINDRFRQKGNDFLGQNVLSQQVAAMPLSDRIALKRMVSLFDNFTEGNDPYGEHNFGSVEYQGEKYFWKIDYWDENYEYGSEDPSNLAITRRVLTIMHSSEY
jgi:Protein of unknown function (DUF3768)